MEAISVDTPRMTRKYMGRIKRARGIDIPADRAKKNPHE